MGRNRVLSFMSQFSAGRKTPSPPPSTTPPSDSSPFPKAPSTKGTPPDMRRPPTPPSNPDYDGSPVNTPPRNSPPQTHQRRTSRPLSMLQAFPEPTMEINADTIPELQPIFTLLNSHSNKLYHEGYFLKLDDQNTQGRPNPDRTWTECFAQLVGTVLSLWDASELDAAGDNGEVLPKFINLTDASIKMIEALPTRSNEEQPLQNILSLSTAGRNRYLLHFNSHDSLVEWTAAIRLSMYEYSTLQEAYTGALVAGKGKTLNNINIIMERSRFKIEEWVRVRFGAGVPWRRCWCVITPPDEKEYAKLQKDLKKRSAYDRSAVPMLKGDIKFYDTKTEGKKQKKTKPIATITEAFAAYAVYPQTKALVDASTLIKIEGNISIHTQPPSSSEGFVFVMPETRPAVSGFETMMRFLFPTWDTMCLYGRPGRLVASILDSRSLMFAMPKHRLYGYLELQDVTGLMADPKSMGWNEKEWRKHLKDATGTRMNSIDEGTRSHSRSASRTSAGLSIGNKLRVGFASDDVSTSLNRLRSSSESNSPDSVYSNSPLGNHPHLGIPAQAGGLSSDEDRSITPSPPVEPVESMRTTHTPEPVTRPPAFNHNPQDRPTPKAYHSPELRRANSRLSAGTLAQMSKATGIAIPSVPDIPDETGHAYDSPPVPPHGSSPGLGFYANGGRFDQPLNVGNYNTQEGERPPSNRSNLSAQRPVSPYGHAVSFIQGPMEYRPPTSEGRQPYAPGPIQPPSQQPISSNGPPYEAQYNNFGPGPESRDYPGEGLPTFPHGTPASAQRKPLPERHQSITASDIVDHYTTQSRVQYNNQVSMPPPPPPHQQFGALSMQDPPEDVGYSRPSVERPRAGVLKTVGGTEQPAAPKRSFDLPDINFGPTVNYGAPAVLRKPAPAEPQTRVRTPTEQGRQSQTGHRRQESATMPWQPAHNSSPSRSQGLTPEQYVQQRAAAAASYGHGRNPSANSLGGRSQSPSVNSARSISPQPQYQAMGPGGQPQSHPQPFPNMQQQYQNRAF